MGMFGGYPGISLLVYDSMYLIEFFVSVYKISEDEVIRLEIQNYLFQINRIPINDSR
jgi:hypothetical protein